MLYEYDINETLSKEDIGKMLLKSKKLKRNYITLFVLIFTVLMGILLLIGYMIDNSIFIKGTTIFIGTYIVGVFMIVFRWKRGIKNLARNVCKIRDTKNSVEIEDSVYTYREGNYKAILTKDTVIEIVLLKEYILIIIAPKLLKYIYIDPTIIPNDLFGSEDIFNEFINKIS